MPGLTDDSTSAAFVPSLFVGTAKVYSGRREADVLMSSTHDSTYEDSRAVQLWHHAVGDDDTVSK
jgi:hypothetical protein